MKNKLLNIISVIAVVCTTLWAIFTTKEKTMQIGIKHENMATSVKPGDDFYDFATKGWRDNNPIPDDYTTYSSFHVLRDTNLERVRNIAENASLHPIHQMRFQNPQNVFDMPDLYS